MFNLFKRGDKAKTFKPLQAHKKGTRRYNLHSLARRTLGSGDMRGAVKLPEGEDLNEWLAVHTVDFYNEIVLLYDAIEPYCKEADFPSMTAGPKYEYLWADGKDYPRPTRVPARQYIELLLNWVEGIINDDSVFPNSTEPFPSNFRETVKPIFKRMFRVYAHIYFHHWDRMVEDSMDAHLNTCFKHFLFFVLEFDLIPEKELAPLRDLIDAMTNPSSDRSREQEVAAATGAARGGGGGAST